jgi:lipopolysaccharide/colanic/teichoic acid biosynthesis glycosyltransferase
MQQDSLHKPSAGLTRMSHIKTSFRYQEKPCGGIAKRIFDVALALMAIILLSPLLLAVGLAVKLSDRGPAFLAIRGSVIRDASSNAGNFAACCRIRSTC